MERLFQIVREPRYKADVILLGEKEAEQIVIRAAAILAVQGIMARAVVALPNGVTDGISAEEALPEAKRWITIVLSGDERGDLSGYSAENGIVQPVGDWKEQALNMAERARRILVRKNQEG